MSFPMKVNSYADYQRVLEVADKFNIDKPELPIHVTLVGHIIDEEGSGQFDQKGRWYLDIVSSSPGRLQFFMDEVEKLEKESRKLEKMLKLAPFVRPLALPEPKPVLLEEPKAKPKRTRKPKLAKSIKEEDNSLSKPLEKTAVDEDPVYSSLLNLFKDDSERQE